MIQEPLQAQASPRMPWLLQLKENLFISVSMTLLLAWGFIHVGKAPAASFEAIPPLLLMFCAGICLLLLVTTRAGATQTGAMSAVVLVSFAIIGVVGSNASVSNLVPISGEHFVRSNRERWEIVALVSTAFMALIYLDTIDIVKEGFKNKRGFGGLNVVTMLLGASVILIYCALIYLHSPIYHYICVLTVTVLFGSVDLYLWVMLKDDPDISIRNHSDDSKSLFFLLDAPVFLGLLVLLGFFISLKCDDPTMSEIVTGKISDIVNRSCVEAFPFLAGALAFQMISINPIYVFFAFGLHKKIEKIVEDATQ